MQLSPEFLRKLELLRVTARKVHGGRFSARHRSKKLGQGIDFADYRAYAPGDDFKDIDWNLFGRLDRLMVRLAQEETELHLHLLVDCSRSMSFDAQQGAPGQRKPAQESKASLARKVATALSYVALSRLDRVRVFPFSESLHHPLSPPRSKAQAARIHSYLSNIEHGDGTDLATVAHSFVGVAHQRGLVLILSDFLSPSGWQPALDILRHARFEPALLQVSAPEDAEPPPSGEVILRDAETGRRVRVHVTDALAQAYRQAFLEHCESLRSYARSHNLFYGHARTDQPWEEVVLGTMRAERLLI
ncbi:MAG TPA: DUF58 domain-containing protein [Deltaproteobacteria bacterium]|nr:DUF58 domain-containing protein [Deltaproteobacteria bacterium]HCP45433.1 DUF58 domain-containing protein [Deltaproteobacteria bacterium]